MKPGPFYLSPAGQAAIAEARAALRRKLAERREQRAEMAAHQLIERAARAPGGR